MVVRPIPVPPLVSSTAIITAELTRELVSHPALGEVATPLALAGDLTVLTATHLVAMRDRAAVRLATGAPWVSVSARRAPVLVLVGRPTLVAPSTLCAQSLTPSDQI